MRHLGLFAKFWEPGKVKTRLARTIGSESASNVYRAFLEHAWTRFAVVGSSREIVFTPINARASFASAVPDSWQLRPQAEGDLGIRMYRFFQQCFESNQNTSQPCGSNPARVVVVGADIPELTPELIEQAFQQLINNDLTLGPSDDGGYYLIGMRQQAHDVFSGIPWSTPQVFAATVRMIERQGLTYGTLPERTDIDEHADLLKLETSLATSTARHAINLREKLRQALHDREDSARVAD